MWDLIVSVPAHCLSFYFLSLQILAGLLGCGAVLALVPAVPIFVAIAGALPADISVDVSKAQLKEKESICKGCHRTFKHSFAKSK